MAKVNLTAPMLRALKALDAEPDKRLLIADFFSAMRVSIRGRYVVKNRMEERNLVATVIDHDKAFTRCTFVTITFGGLQALKAAA